MDREARDHPLARLLVAHRVEDRVIGEERIAREVHLRHEALRERPAHQREVDVRGAPGVVVVAPRVRPGLDREEAVATLVVGQAAPGAGEVGVQRRRPVVDDVLVAPAGVGLPDLDQRVAQRLALGVEHPAGDDDPLADRLALVLGRQVGVLRRDRQRLAQRRAGDLRDRVRKVDQRLLGMAQRGRLVRRVVQRRVRGSVLAQVAARRVHHRGVVAVPGFGAHLGDLLILIGSSARAGHPALRRSAAACRPGNRPRAGPSRSAPAPAPRSRRGGSGSA